MRNIPKLLKKKIPVADEVFFVPKISNIFFFMNT